MDIFITLLIFAITIKLSKQIIHGILECINYITNLGIDDINGKILRIFKNIKKLDERFIFFSRILTKKINISKTYLKGENNT